MSRKHSDYLDNPNTQIRFHKRMMRLWVFLAPVVILAYIISILMPRYATGITSGLILFTALISLYANWDTDYGALSSAQASKKADLIDDIKADTEGIQDVQDNRINY